MKKVWIILVILAFGLAFYWFKLRFSKTDAIGNAIDAITQNSALPQSVSPSNPLGNKIPEVNPLDKTNPFKYKNPFSQ